MDFRLRIPVRRPAGMVFALLAGVQDHVGAPARSGVRMDKSPSGPTTEGTRWHERVRLAPGWWMSVDSVVTAIEDPDLLAMDFRSALVHRPRRLPDRVHPQGCVLRQHFVLRWPRLLDRLADIRDAIERSG